MTASNFSEAIKDFRRALSAIFIEFGVSLLPDEEERAEAYLQLLYEGVVPPYQYGTEEEDENDMEVPTTSS